jgi:hypothetical protein
MVRFRAGEFQFLSVVKGSDKPKQILKLKPEDLKGDTAFLVRFNKQAASLQFKQQEYTIVGNFSEATGLYLKTGLYRQGGTDVPSDGEMIIKKVVLDPSRDDPVIAAMMVDFKLV